MNEGHLYHAMTLSFYFLLRYKEEKDLSEYGFYFKSLKETI